MLVRSVIAIAGLVVAVFSIAMGDYWGAAAVVVVLAAIFGWRPSWLRVEVPAELGKAEAAIRLSELRPWRRVLVPCAFVGVGVQIWALHSWLTSGDLMGVSVMAAIVSALLVAWAAVTHRSIERLEDWLLADEAQ